MDTRILTVRYNVGPISLPFIGSAIQLAYEARNLKHFELFEKLCRKYGPIVKLKAGVLNIGNKNSNYTTNIHIYSGVRL
jgi:hypothetical protein